ncbi:MAG: DUF1569 domain-containing protein [Bacteroidota bacterium]
MKSLFEVEAYHQILSRINQLDVNTERLWGKMSAGQMAWHCQFPLKLAIKNEAKGIKGSLFIRWLYKKSMYSDRLWPKNLPTAPAFKATEEKDFETEIELLKDLVSECHALRNRKHWNPHPLFGNMTHEQWGKTQYKHLDHHLRQFGV